MFAVYRDLFLICSDQTGFPTFALCVVLIRIIPRKEVENKNLVERMFIHFLKGKAGVAWFILKLYHGFFRNQIGTSKSNLIVILVVAMVFIYYKVLKYLIKTLILVNTKPTCVYLILILGSKEI